MAIRKDKFKFKIDIKGQGEVIKRLRNASGRFVPSTSLIVENLAKASSEVLKFHTPVATGALRDSTVYDITRGHTTWDINLEQNINSFTGIPVSLLNVTGRSAGGNPPPIAIQDWIIAKGISPEIGLSKRARKSLSIKELAFAISRSIGRQGTQQYIKGGASYMDEAQVAIDQLLEQATENIKINIRTTIQTGSPT